MKVNLSPILLDGCCSVGSSRLPDNFAASECARSNDKFTEEASPCVRTPLFC
jgi:hypothetical protein